jgi:sulfite reductase (ferredoxin)
MTTFREGIENLKSVSNKALIEKDILELGQKIIEHRTGQLNDDKFKALRLARGVYGQRQTGVQMIRIKLPFGKVTTQQINRISDVSDEYSTGHLHITTRQDIQIHYVNLDRTPQLWSELEKNDITLREACGNTVRNVTASAIAGIDKDEPFDVSPYADLVFRYFLRKPFGQELGRKIKIAFSSSDDDDAFAFIHDFGFIPKLTIDKKGSFIKGFKVVVGGGLGAQPFLAKTAYDFLSENEILPFIEASIRVFDRYGERNNRNKARLKYVIAKIGIEAFIQLVEIEKHANQFQAENDHEINSQDLDFEERFENIKIESVIINSTNKSFIEWVKTNVIEQKQTGYFAAFVKVSLGNFTTDQARRLAQIISKYAANDARFTINQSILLKFILPENLELLFLELNQIGLGESGYNSIADITACPGTDTCNLGISNSTNVSTEIESLIRAEYPELIYEQNIKIKISGCMNSCGQHGLAQIGFHGSSIKTDKGTLPALQVLLGGGKLGNGEGLIAEKVIKLPSKRVLESIRFLLNDFESFQNEDETFNEYYIRQGNKYFYTLLKPLADTTNLIDSDFIDWGNEEKFKTAIGVGECAGVMIDLVATLFYDAEEKIALSFESLTEQRFGDSIYQAYSAGIHAAKAILLQNSIRCNTHIGIIHDFDLNLGKQFDFSTENSFSDFITRINKNSPNKEFAKKYLTEIKTLVDKIKFSLDTKNLKNV